MTIWEQTDSFISKPLINSYDVIWEVEGDMQIFAVAFEFKSGFFIVCTNIDDDSVSIYRSSNLENWISEQTYPMELTVRPSIQCKCFIGKNFWNIWQCQGTVNYTDAIDIGFENSTEPVVKFFCIGSELIIFKLNGHG